MATLSAPRKKFTVLALATVLTITGAGVAFAFWTSSGTGTGTATTGDSLDFTITAEAAVGTIEPGSPGQTVDFTVTNSSGGTQSLSAVTVALADEEGVAWVPDEGCDIDDYAAAITSPPDTGTIAAGSSVSGTVTVTLANTGVNQDACQGQTVPLYFQAS